MNDSTLVPWPLSGFLFISHLPVQPWTFRCSSQLKSPMTMIQSFGFNFLQFANRFSSWTMTSSEFGLVCLYLCGMYTHTTNSGHIGPSSHTQTMRDSIDPLARIFSVNNGPSKIPTPEAGSVHVPSSSISASALVIQYLPRHAFLFCTLWSSVRPRMSNSICLQ